MAETEPDFRTVSAIDGHIVFWSARSAQLVLDVMTAPTDSNYLAGQPVVYLSQLRSWMLAYMMLATIERWATDGRRLRFEERTGPDGSPRIRISDGNSWMVLVESSPVDQRIRAA